MANERAALTRGAVLLVAVTSLGYFVDVYDLIVFSVIRTASLTALGVTGGDLLTVGLTLLNIQLAGVLLGGVVLGILGDKMGRLSVLFGSIVLYSAANLLNAHVSTIWQYEVLRFISGFGLAGELGVGVTLVSEVLPPSLRGYGTMFIAAVGLLGAVAASEAGIHLEWQSAYTLGGLLGLGLLVMRVGLVESAIFRRVLGSGQRRGDLFMLLSNRTRVLRLILCVAAGLPLYFVIGILVTAAPEIGVGLGLRTAPSAAVAVMVSYIAMSAGDVACSTLSQVLRSRRLPLIVFQLVLAAALVVYLAVPVTSSYTFYWHCAFLGFGIGFWALVVTNASEQFGTNLRATVTTIVPNMIRAMLIPISSIFLPLKSTIGVVPAAGIVGGACIALALVAIAALDETFGRSLEFVEE